MKKLAFVAVTALAPLSFAHAADTSWAGPYAGVNLGFDSYNSQFIDYDDNFDNQGLNGDVRTAIEGGIHGGWNFQSSNLVYGGELAIDQHTARSENKPYGLTSTSLLRAELGTVFSLKGRIGVASGDTLGFMTAGISESNIDYTINTGTGGDQSKGGSVYGLNYGVGVSHKCTDRIVATVSLNGIKFDTSQTVQASGSSFAQTSSLDNLTIGVAWKF